MISEQSRWTGKAWGSISFYLIHPDFFSVDFFFNVNFAFLLLGVVRIETRLDVVVHTNNLVHQRLTQF